jgi:hypothetical protein
MDGLLETIKMCALKGVKVLLVNFPTHPGYNNTNAYNAFGPTHAIAKEMIREIQAEADKDDNLTFYDANQWGMHDYTEFEFVDYMHLCVEGAKKLSTRIDSILHRIID